MSREFILIISMIKSLTIEYHETEFISSANREVKYDQIAHCSKASLILLHYLSDFLGRRVNF